MKWIYQIKNYMCENTIYFGGVIGTLYLILTCNHLFWKKKKTYDSSIVVDIKTMSELDDILSNNSDEDFEIVSEHDEIDIE